MQWWAKPIRKWGGQGFDPLCSTNNSNFASNLRKPVLTAKFSTWPISGHVTRRAPSRHKAAQLSINKFTLGVEMGKVVFGLLSVYLAGAFCICIAAWQASSFFATLRLRQRLKQNRKGFANQPELNEPKTTRGLNAGDMSSFVGVTSVTENSTELLDHVPSPKRDTQR